MKKWVYIFLGVLLVGIQLINVYMIFDINRDLSLYCTQASQKPEEDKTVTYESPVMNLQQAADYIGVTSKQLQIMINIETAKLDKMGSYSGEMIPYFKVNDNLYFYKKQVDLWLEYVSVEKSEYNTVQGYILQ